MTPAAGDFCSTGKLPAADLKPDKSDPRLDNGPTTNAELGPFHRRSVIGQPCRGIVWLASYPKSGNTWFRIFLRNLLHEPVDEEEISGLSGISSSRDLFDQFSGLDSSNLTADEIDGLRPRVYEEVVLQSETLPLFLKSHDTFTYLPDGQPLLSQHTSAGAIYFLRNPLDVAVSYAYHAGHDDFAKVVHFMASRDRAIARSKDGLDLQLRQRLLDWSGHARSWLGQTEVPVHLLRYEDMLARPLETFRGAVRFAGLDHDDAQIAAALEQCRFDPAPREGTRTRVPRASDQGESLFPRRAFGFRGADKLTDDLVARVLADHGDVMRRFGYLNENNVLLV